MATGTYKASQLSRLNRILALKDLGLPLEHIKNVLENDVSPEEIRGMLKVELDTQRREAQQQLERVEARLEFSHYFRLG